MSDFNSNIDALNHASSNIAAVAGMISAMDSSSADRRFAEEQNAISREFNAHQAQLARDYNTSEREATQQFNIEQWERNNAYNTPFAQLQRMLDAGINPNNAAASIAGVSASSSPVSSSPSSSPSASSSPIGVNSSQIPTSIANASQIFAQNRLINSQTELNLATAEKTRADKDLAIIDKQFKPLQYQSQIDATRQSIQKMASDGRLSEAQARTATELLPSLKALNVGQIEQLKIQTGIAAKEYYLKDVERQKVLQEIKTLKAQASAANASAEDLRAHAELNKAQKRLTDLNGDMQQLDVDWKRKCHNLGYDPSSSQLDRLIDGAGSFIDRMAVPGIQGIVDYVGGVFDGIINSVVESSVSGYRIGGSSLNPSLYGQ